MARAGLKWSETRLARAAGLSISTVNRFEREQRTLYPKTVESLQRAFEEAGVEFTNGGEPGVKLRKQA
jgi:transcriptional regulator with XRE-family HTH domain